MRPNFDELFCNVVEIIAQRSTCIHQQIGAVLTKDNRIISIGYNGRASGDAHCIEEGQCYRKTKGDDRDFKVCLHAEQNAIMFAARAGISTIGTAIYVNTDPCITCAKLIIQAGIQRVVIKHRPGVRRYQYGIDYLTDHGIELVIIAGGS